MSEHNEQRPLRREGQTHYQNPRRRRRRRRRPYAHLVKPALVALLLLAVLVLAVVDFNSYALTVELEEEIYAEFGMAFDAPDPQAKLTGGLFDVEKDGAYSVSDTVDVYSLGQQEIEYEISCKTLWLLFPRTFEKTVTRKVTVRDTTAPVITLQTAEVPTTYRGAAYVEEGFTAMDACDGDVSANVTSVQEGDQVIYTVTDSSGNTATAVRDIVYREGVEPNGKTIYLTFDDGPGKYTEELLDILGKYNVKATFFVVGTDYLHILERIAREGHAIGVHSHTHDLNAIYKSEDAFFADAELMQEKIRQYTGSRTNLLRFPGGSSNTSSRYNQGIMTRLSTAVGQHGYYYFDWNVDSDDAGSARTADKVFENVTTGAAKREYSVVLQHDIKEYSVDAVERIILWGLENGYAFRALDENSPGCHHKIFN